MCKSIANGGQRCQAHTRQAVSDQMVSYTTALTPLNSEQARAALRDLEVEGANLPDPEREEVDEWLERTITQVRYEPNLTESRRERIIRRLREALGRVLPSGATFHAWKSIMAEAWQRSRRKAAIFFTVGVITFSGGCGLGAGGSSPDDAPRGPSVVQVSSYEEFASDSLPAPKVAPEVARKFGEADAVDAYNMGARLILDHQMDGDTLGSPINTEVKGELAEVRKHLTPARQADLDDRVARASKDEDAYAAVAVLQAQGVDSGEIAVVDPNTGERVAGSLRKGVKTPVVGRSISNPRLSVDPDGRLKATFTSQSTLRVTGGDANYLAPLKNETTLWFTKSGDKWLIDGWNADWSNNPGPTRLDTK